MKPALGFSRFRALLAAALGAACSDGRLPAFVSSTDIGGATASGGSGGSPASGSGNSGAAGTTTAGGSGAGGSGGEITPSGLIDDFEDGDTRPIAGDGWWYAQGDDGRVPEWHIAPTAGPNGTTTLALHASGEWYMDWGAQVGVDLPGPRLDASAFSALRFWARAAPNSTRSISVQTPDASGKLTYALEITTSWQEYVIPFRDFAPTDAAPRPFDASNISYIQFFVLSADRFDYWLDDVGFR